MRIVIILPLMLALAACSSSSDDSSKRPPNLNGIIISPNTANIDSGQSAGLTCLGVYSDNVNRVLEATWTNLDPTVVTLDSGTGTSVTVTGTSTGTATITADAGGHQASATVNVLAGVPADPNPVYGSGAGLLVYPPQGGGAPTSLGGGANNKGFMLDPDNEYLYYTTTTGILRRIEIATGENTLRAYLPVQPGDSYFGLEHDSQGLIYTQSYQNSDVVRHDPSTFNWTTVGTNPNGTGELAIGPDDNPYTTNAIGSAGSTMIYRHNLATDQVTFFGIAPASMVTSNGILITSGLAMNSNGEAFSSSSAENRIYRWIDINGDGWAIGAGESGVYATLPFASGNFDNMLYGIGLAGGGSLLVNVRPQATTTTAEQGIYWIADKNNDGDAEDFGEIIYYNANPVINGFDGGCVTAPH